MRLKRLELRGFKTFASPVTLDLDTPITAIVGPNGSGKSNVADAVRWVLGEQSSRALRTKRTEDVIFAGGNGRPQLGMAEVALTLDNEDGWLGLPQAEVCFTRRAFRSGESEYFINGARARWRDLSDLVLKANLGPSGYTVVGQGMVDLALSQRPEERRALFEEAADVKRHYLKIKESRDKLAATEDNMRRVADLAGELAPRLASLERQAERARRHEFLSAELRGLLARWYRHQWRRSQTELARLEAEEARASDELAAAQAAAAAKADSAAALSHRRGELGQQLAALSADLGGVRGDLERTQLEWAVGRERATALVARRAQIVARRETLAEEGERDRKDLALARTAQGKVIEDRERLARDLAQLGQSAAAAQAAREARAAEQAAAERELERLTESWAQTRAALARQGERHVAADRERQAQLAGLREAERRLAEGEAELVGGDEALGKVAARLRALAADAEEREREAGAAEAEALGAEHRLEELRRERQVLQARLAVLDRWREDLSGYHAGARAVLQAARSGKGGRLSGIVGIVAGLLRVPAELETAIEVALGGRLQDVVVEHWRDAEVAIEFLKHTRAGRATFLPLDTVRGGLTANPVAGPGVLGLASELVQYDPVHAVIARHLLGRTIVVQDLAVARRALAACPSGWQIVTLSGEVVRASGAVTGGTLGPQQGGLLGQERERRDLPGRLRTLEGALGSAERQVAERRTVLHELRAAVGRLVALQREQEASRQRLEAEARAGRREVERWRREGARAGQAAQTAAREEAMAAEREASTQQALVEGERARELAKAAVEEARLALATAEADGGDSLRCLAEARAALATAARDESRLAVELAERERELARAARAAEQLSAEDAELAGQAAGLDASLGELAERARDLGRQKDDLAAQEAALRGELAAAERQLGEVEASRRELQARLSELAAGQSAASAAVQRARGELAALRERGLGDLGVEHGEGPRQLRLPWEEAADDAEEEVNPDQLRRQIDQFRAQLRGLPAVNPEAVRDYEELAARHSYLTSQNADLQMAGRALRQAIGDLELAMRKQFERTFAAVAGEFRRYFTTLFGGGSAHLTLTDPDNLLDTGVDIVAQPPGKRLQNLALLSGGERALTAVALLFALLSVKPAPFCVLDEVDAALDDANVARCLGLLRSLAERTQFVIITHNRITMEAAGALYGVSIGRDGASRAISLRLEDAPGAERQAAASAG